MRPAAEFYERLIGFASEHVSSQDIDPVYPVLEQYLAGHGPEHQAWTVLCYVAFYNLPAGLQFAKECEYPSELDYGFVVRLADQLPKGTERRGFRRPGYLHRHLASVRALAAEHGSVEGWLRLALENTAEANWRVLQINLRRAWGNGRWAAYKTGEILSTVLDYPVRPTDAGHAWSSGPRQGLALFYGPVQGNGPRAVAKLDAQTEELRGRLKDDGVPLTVEQLETVLCDFHSHQQGRYYVGHDIDQMWKQVTDAMNNGWLDLILYEQLRTIRAKVFDQQYLMEADSG